jgi:hypothetical protein
LLIRRTYPELESSLLAYFRRDVPRNFYKSYNESKRSEASDVLCDFWRELRIRVTHHGFQANV